MFHPKLKVLMKYGGIYIMFELIPFERRANRVATYDPFRDRAAARKDPPQIQ